MEKALGSWKMKRCILEARVGFGMTSVVSADRTAEAENGARCSIYSMCDRWPASCSVTSALTHFIVILEM